MTDEPTIANIEQARAWDGDEGAHWAAHAERYDAATPDYTRRLAEAARIGVADVVLDVGCGNGQSTRDAARAAARGRALGLDLSAAMLARARASAHSEGLTNVEFAQGDAQVFAFDPGAFDVAISRFGAMFFADPVAAFTNVAHALKRGGRLALVAWRPLPENEWFSEIGAALALGGPVPSPPAGAPSPFGLADPEYVRTALGAAGFADVNLEALDATFRAGADTSDAFDFVRGLGFTRFRLEGLDADQTRAALDALRATLAAHDTGAGVLFGSAAWLITATRP